MVEVPDYSFISKDTGPSLSGSINNWLTIDKNVYDLKEKGANEAIGNILQQSTDAQGNVDYGSANALAAKAGPRVQMGMQTMLQANSARRGEQISQGGAINTNIARAGASLMQDSSDANVDATIDNLISTNPGQRQLYEAERQRLKTMNPQQRVQYSYQHVLGQLDGADQLLRGGYGAPAMTTFGGTSAPVVSTPGSPYGAPRTAVGGGVAHTQDPATYYGPQSSPIMYDANGQVTNDPTKAVRSAPRDVPRGPAMGAPPPGSVGGPPGGTAPQPGLPPGAPPPPPGQRLVGGRFVTPPAAAAPNASTPLPAPAPTAGVVTGPATGSEGDAAIQHAGDARARTLSYQRDIQPIEGAITALSGADTGRASETLNSLRANIQDITPAFLQRMLPTSLTDPAARKAFEEANKYLTQMQLQAPGGARSDVGAAAAGAATPSVHISNAAAREVALAVLAQRRLEQSGTLLFNQSGKSGAEFDRHMGAWNTQADPRAFIVDKMTPDERAAYVKGLGGTDTPAYQQYKRSYRDGVAAGVIPPPQPVRQKQSLIAPSEPVSNPLQMTG